MNDHISCDSEDLIVLVKCGCYAREGYNAGDDPYLVHCDLHVAAVEFVKQFMKNPYAFTPDQWASYAREVVAKAEGE